jgi:hypothetical protein
MSPHRAKSKTSHMDGLTVWRLMYSPCETKENTTMTTTPETSEAQRAEQAGSAIASQFLNTLANASNQAEAFCALKAALCDAYNDDGDLIVAALAGGFAVGIVNVLERGIQAIREDRE